MIRACASSSPPPAVPGHFAPLLPLAAACRRAGDGVLVVGPPILADAAKGAGYPFRPGAAPPQDELGATWARVPTVAPEEADRIVVGEIFAGLNVRAMLPTPAATLREWRPGLVLRDTAEFASAVAADAAGIAHARVGVSLTSVEAEMLAVAAPRLEVHAAGLAGRVAASPCLTAFPAALEDPSGGARGRGRRPGPGARDRRPTPWSATAAPARRSARSPRASRWWSSRRSPTSPATPSGWRRSAPGWRWRRTRGSAAGA